MKLTVLSHTLSSNASMRAHRLASAATSFGDVSLIGPVEPKGAWPALPMESWIRPVPKRRLPKFANEFLRLIDAADGDVLLAVKPQLASYGVALVAAERRNVPVILDLDDLDVALAPRSTWESGTAAADLRRPGSAVYVSLLTRAVGAATAVTVASTALQRRFGGTLVPHGCFTDLFDPQTIDRQAARQAFGFTASTVVFPGTPRGHKGLDILGKAVARLPGVRLAAFCRPKDLANPEWRALPLDRLAMIRHAELPRLLAAADVVAITESDSEAARYQTPMKVYDAMAMGRPIVANAVGDLPQILEGAALLVPPGDVQAMSAAIERLLHDPEHAKQLADLARARCLREFSIANVAEKLRRVVTSVSGSSV